MNISLISAIYSIYLVVSASFMRYILNFINSGMKNFLPLSIFISVLFAFFFLSLFFFLIARKKFINLLFLMVIFVLIVLYTLSFEIIEERIHILQFGLLGFLVSLDNKNRWYLFPLIWVFTITTIDEVFQFYLPNRVGDIRDILFGVVGGMFGIILHYGIFKINFKGDKKK